MTIFMNDHGSTKLTMLKLLQLMERLKDASINEFADN